MWLNTSDESKETDVIVGSTRQQDDYPDYDQASHVYLHMALLRMQGSVLYDTGI